MKTLLLSTLGIFVLFSSSVFEASAQKFVVNCPAEVCAPTTVDLTAPAVTAGSDTDLKFTYWVDANATIPLNNPSAVADIGTNTYYIQATSNSRPCNQILPVTVIIGTHPVLDITPPKAQCVGSTVDLTATVYGYGSDPALNYYFFSDPNLTKAIPDPTKVIVNKNTTFYLNGIFTCGCNTVVPIPITVNPEPNLIIKDPAPVCAPAIIKLQATITNYSSHPDYQYSYFADAALQNPIAQPDSIKQSGTYYIKATSQAGCFCTKPVHVVINPKPALAVLDPAPVCGSPTGTTGTTTIGVNLQTTIQHQGANPGLAYTYFSDASLKTSVSNPSNVSIAGTYYIVATNQTGCQTSAPVHVSISAPPALAVLDPAPVCGSTTGSTGTTTTSVNLQTTIQNQNANPGLTYTYFSDASLKTPVSNPTNVNIAGTYYIVATNQAGCQTSAPVHVSISTPPALAVLDPAPVCGSTTGSTGTTTTSVNLQTTIQNQSANPGLIYTYFSDATLKTPVSNPTNVSIAGTYYIVATNQTGCQTSAPVHVSISASPTLAVLDPAPVCGSTTGTTTTSVNLQTTIQNQNANPGLTYTYFSDAALKTPVSNPANISTAGTYYIVATNQTGCQTSAPVHVNISAPPALTVLDPAPTCGTTTGVNLQATIQNQNANPGLTYSYFSDASLKTSVSNPANVSTSGTYYIVATNQAGCQTSAPVHILAGNPPPLTVTDPAPICGSGSVNLSSTINNYNKAYQYTYYSDSNLQNAVASPDNVNQSGKYFIQATSSGGCTSVQDVQVTINPIPVLKITPPTAGYLASADLTSPSFVAGSDPGLVYTYYLDAEATIQVPQPDRITQSGEFYIVATNPKTGCTVKGPIKIILNPSTLFIPTLFTPNGDGVNDTFVIKGIESYPDNTLQVFNRWGNKVYEATNYGISQKYWNGSGLLEGTYYYVLKINSGNGTQTRSGWTMILLKPLR